MSSGACSTAAARRITILKMLGLRSVRWQDRHFFEGTGVGMLTFAMGRYGNGFFLQRQGWKGWRSPWQRFFNGAGADIEVFFEGAGVDMLTFAMAAVFFFATAPGR